MNDHGVGLEGWGEYKRLILKELERLNREVEHVGEELAAIRVEIAMLKVKASLWGAAAGAVPAGIAAVVWYLVNAAGKAQ